LGRDFVLALSKRWPGAIQLVDVEPNLFLANMIAQRGLHPPRRRASDPVGSFSWRKRPERARTHL